LRQGVRFNAEVVQHHDRRRLWIALIQADADHRDVRVPLRPPGKPAVAEHSSGNRAARRIEPRDPAPVYPQEAAVAGLSGDVRLLVPVYGSGRAADLRVLLASNVPSFDRAALEAVRQWRFLPAHCDGRAVAWPVCFRIEP